MSREAFSHVETWVFDLDNTLYPPAARLFDQIEVKMTAFMMQALGVDEAEAHRLRALYWREHGTTLAGLMDRHQMPPDDFLFDVHDIDLSALTPDTALAAAIAALPGNKIVYTNGSRLHAERVTAARGLSGLFDGLYGVEDAGFVPKPKEEAFTRIFSAARVAPNRAAMFEDDPRNLEAPHAFGMRTILVGPEDPAPHIHHQTEDLPDFLSRVV